MVIPKIGKMKISGSAKTFFCGVLVLLVSYFTYFNGYYKPDRVIFDEHDDIVHAERYLNRIVYFDVNPPIGNMFIALGEKIFNPNKDVDVVKHVNVGCIFDDIGNGFSFVGVRFFPVLFAFLNALLFFMILYRLSKNNFLSLMFTSLYLFENAAIVHFRAAMLDSTMIFFSFLAILYFLYLYEKKKRITYLNYFLLGCFTSLAAFTKFVGFISLLLFLFLIFKELNLKSFKKKLWFFIKRSSSYVAGVFIIGFLTYYLHIALCSNIILGQEQCDQSVQLGASTGYIDMIGKKELTNPIKSLVPMRDYFKYIAAPQSMLPGLNDRIKSNPLLWPLGIRNIQYEILDRDDDGKIDKNSYLMFQGNAVNWLLGLVAVITSLLLIVGRFIFKTKVSNKKLFNYILIFTSLYVGFMAAVTFISFKRPLFIHTYLLPLFFSFILFFLLFNYFLGKDIVKKSKVLNLAIVLLVFIIFGVFLYMSPLSYAKPVTYLECEKTKLVNYWEDDCASE